MREFFIDASTASLTAQGQASLHAIGEPSQDVRRVPSAVKFHETGQ